MGHTGRQAWCWRSESYILIYRKKAVKERAGGGGRERKKGERETRPGIPAMIHLLQQGLIS